MAAIKVKAEEELVQSANQYEGDNIFQELFYYSDLVDVDATADANPEVVVLFSGDKILWDDQKKEWYLSKKLNLHCPYCKSSSITKNGKGNDGKQRHACSSCKRSFVLEIDPSKRRKPGWLPEETELLLSLLTQLEYEYNLKAKALKLPTRTRKALLSQLIKQQYNE